MYENVIVAIDLSDASEKVVNKALELVAGDASKLALVHAVEPIPASWGAGAYYAIGPLEFQQRIIDHAKQKIGEIASKAGLTGKQHVLLGTPVYEIRKLVKELKADAIVIGSHGYGGWKLLLGSTSNKVIHGATCDVLTVHISEC